MSCSNVKQFFTGIALQREGCNLQFTPCEISLSAEPRTKTISLECGSGVHESMRLQGWEISAEFGQAGLPLFAMLNGGVVQAEAGIGDYVVIEPGKPLPVVTLVGRMVDDSGVETHYRFLNTSLSPVGIDFNKDDFPVTSLEGFAQKMEVVKYNVAPAMMNTADAVVGWNATDLFHAENDNLTLAGVPVTSGQVDNWCNEATATTLFNQATISKRPSRVGNLVRFDGVDDTLNLALPTTGARVTPLVVAMTVKITESNATATAQTIFQGATSSIGIAATDTFWRISGVATNLNFAHGKTWHRVIYVMNGTAHQLYIDGTLIGAVTGVTPSLTTATLGQTAATATLGMDVGAVEIYRHIFTASEIAQLDARLCEYAG